MGFTSILVTIEPDLGVYLPGQTVQGKVTATVGSSTKCRAVKLKCNGKAKVHWTEKHGDDTKHYNAKEEYFNMKVNIWSNAEERIEAGTYSWPFQFTLPQNIPSSFEGTVGWVRYKIKAQADIPFAFDDKHSAYFSVNDPCDLNYHPEAKKSLVLRKSDTSCCCCCIKGPVVLNFNCLRSGAVIGEGFKIRGEIENQGSKPVESSDVVLHQKVKYYSSGGKTKKSKNMVSKVSRGPVNPGDSDYYEDVKLPVKAVVPNLAKCHIMDLEYKIEVTAHFGTCSSVSECADFYIGTVPFMVEGAMTSAPIASMSYDLPPPYSPVDPAAPPVNFVPVAPPAVPWQTFSEKSNQDHDDGNSQMSPGPSAPPEEGHATAPPVGFLLIDASLNEKFGPVMPPMAPPGMPPMGPPGMPPMAPPGMPPMAPPGMPPMAPPGMPPMAPPGMPPMAPPGMPPMAAPGMPPMAPSGMPPMAPPGMPSMSSPAPNAYPITGPAVNEQCFFCIGNRSRLDKKSPPPKYISYIGRMTN